jgi:hypothetical protein
MPKNAEDPARHGRGRAYAEHARGKTVQHEIAAKIIEVLHFVYQ